MLEVEKDKKECLRGIADYYEKIGDTQKKDFPNESRKSYKAALEKYKEVGDIKEQQRIGNTLAAMEPNLRGSGFPVP